MTVEHPLEKRVKALSEAIKSRRELYANALRPPGSRPAFTQQFSQQQALAWWREHRYDDLGQRVVDRMSPQNIMELDQALSQANDSELTGGLYAGE